MSGTDFVIVHYAGQTTGGWDENGNYVISSTEVISRSDAATCAVETLAERLYVKGEILDPTADDFVPWAELTALARHFYRVLISDLSRYHDLWQTIDVDAKQRTPAVVEPKPFRFSLP